MSTIVSILSHQPIPTVLFIKQMAAPTDMHVFISTPEMEAQQKADSIAAATGITKHQYAVLETDANSPALILAALDNYSWPPDTAYLVNITGGTKMMSQMAYIYFSENSRAKIYYWPIGSSHLEQLHPVIEPVEITSPVQLDLATYFKAHGYAFTAQRELCHPFLRAQALMEQALAAGSAGAVRDIWMAKQEHYSKPDKPYLTGGWLEEWLYALLKKALQLPDKHIAFNLKLKNKLSKRTAEADNEVDVAFVYDNRLFLWECKVYNQPLQNGKKIAEPVYKISSLCQSLGLQAVSFVVIFAALGRSENRKAFLTDITRLMRIRQVFGMEDMENQEAFIFNIKKMIGYGT